MLLHNDIVACMIIVMALSPMQYVSKPGVPELLAGLGFHLKVSNTMHAAISRSVVCIQKLVNAIIDLAL